MVSRADTSTTENIEKGVQVRQVQEGTVYNEVTVSTFLDSILLRKACRFEQRCLREILQIGAPKKKDQRMDGGKVVVQRHDTTRPSDVMMRQSW